MSLTSRTIEAACHCGNIRYALQWPEEAFPITVRECGCSFCQKHGGVYTSHPQSELHIEILDSDKVSAFRFGHETADFNFCAVCGSLMYVICPLEGNNYAVVNVNNWENISQDELIHSNTDFDAETVDSRLERRKKNWIPKLVFS
ncbi:MAG: hypothetical protein AAF387_10345 [Pseudomonadota bacterium]